MSLHVLTRVQQIFHESNEDLYVGFIDLKAAFDWIPREWMFWSIKNRNVNQNKNLTTLLDLLQCIYNETYAVMSGEENEEAFKTTSGVRQGGCESP